MFNKRINRRATTYPYNMVSNSKYRLFIWQLIDGKIVNVLHYKYPANTEGSTNERLHT